MISEFRARWADLDSKRHFTEEKKPIRDERAVIAEMLTPAAPFDPEVRVAGSASALKSAAEAGFIEVG